jgi:biotin carboxylase
MRVRLAEREIPQPDFQILRPGQRPSIAYPIVLKPLSMSASRGVIRANDDGEAEAAIARIRKMVPADEPLLAESFVPGAEVAVEGLLRGGELEVLAIFDKPDPLNGPYFEETLYVTPSRQSAHAAIRRTTQEAANALGLTEGPIHAELRVHDDDVTLLEIAARSIGGLCARSLRFGAGIALEEVILRHALDLSLDDLNRADAASGVMMIPIPAKGTLEEVGGQDEARATPGIVGLDIAIAPGREVEPLPEGDRYLGFLFARGDAPEDVERALRQAHSRLDIRIG